MARARHIVVVAAGAAAFAAVAWLAGGGGDVRPPVPLAAASDPAPAARVGSAELGDASVEARGASARVGGDEAVGAAAARTAAERQRFVADTEALLASAAPAAAVLAALRRAPEAAPGAWCALFARAVVEPRCREPVQSGDTPAEFALQRLLRACAAEPAARAALGDLAFTAAPIPASLRERAARAYAATVSPAEALHLQAIADATVDPLLRAALQDGLAAAGAPAAVDRDGM